MKNFGTGTLFATALTDATGTALAVPIEVQFGTLQDVSVDFSFEEKVLYGAKQFPVAAGRGKGKIDIKAKFAEITSTVYGALFFGLSPAAGTTDANQQTSAIPTTPYQVTIVPPNSGVFGQDLGVTLPDGTPYVRVSSGPTTGQYSVSGAVYTFAAADVALSVVISYQYTLATGRRQIAVTNQLMGYSPMFSMSLDGNYGGKGSTYYFPQCTASKLALPLKNDDWTIQELDITVLADSLGNIMTISMND